MTKGDVIPTRRFQRRRFRKEFHDGFVDAVNQPAIDCEPDQERNHAFRCGSHVVLGCRVVVVAALRLAPGLVEAGKILLKHQLPVAGDHHGVDIGVGKFQPLLDAAQACAVETDVLGRGDGPAVIKLYGHAAPRICLSLGQRAGR